MSEVEELTKLFRKLGADDPESWASSQVNEGINQLGRFVFLREAWALVISEDDHRWIDGEIKASELSPEAPTSGTGKALKNVIDKGCDKQDISDAVRGMQYELLFRLCYLLECPDELEQELGEFSWGLMQLDSDGQPIAYIQALHESVLGMDPTGREMRPRTEAY